MLQQFTMNLEDKMTMKISGVTYINIPDYIEKQHGRLQMKSLILIIRYTSCQD